jgi:hypothetical protein
MKNFTLIALALLSLIICSCKKDKQSPYYLTANKDNTNWKADIPGSGISNETAKNEYYVYGHNGEEHITINLLMNSQNQYELNKAKTQFTITVGLDAVSALYTLDDNANNTVTITNTNVNKRTMTGNFNLVFKKSSGHSSYPATVTFTNGKFLLATSTY